MELKQGYKQTEFGVIPEDWNHSKIQDLIDDNYVISHLDGNHGALYPRSSEFVDTGIPYIGANDFYNSNVLFSHCKYLSEQRASVFRKGIAKDGDVLFAHNATVGPVALLKTNYNYVILSTTATYFRCNPVKLINRYLLYNLQSPFFVKQYSAVMSQSTRNQIPITAQRKLTVLLPPLPEQTAIANALSDMDTLISQTEKLIEKKKAIKQGAMQELLKPKEGWVTKKFTDVINYIHGKAHEQFIVENGKYQVVNSKFISTEGTVKKYANVSFLTAKKGDVLTVLSDLPNGKALAKCFYVEEDNKYAVNQRICIWRSTNDYPKFLFYFLNRHKYFMAINDGVSQTHILNGHIEKFFIEIPENYSEQQTIAETLWDIDKELKLIETKLTKLKQQKQGMMQALLTGKIRLVS